ncbi:MAG: HEAT repeat domain-containing protein [Planctomycetes bacterium]|nr:HEAT repeat domain-containing protein [Planctomycetota bacterium]
MRGIATVLLVALLVIPSWAGWPEARNAFAEKYSSAEPAERVKAVRALTDFNRAEAVAFLLECWRSDPDAGVRDALADIVAKIVDPMARTAIRDVVLKHPDPEVRARYCALFADGRQPDRTQVLSDLLIDSSPVVRVRALRTLGRADRALLADVGGLLEDPAPEIRFAAAGALAAIGSIDAVPWLADRLAIEKGERLWAVQDALEKITAQKFGADGPKWLEWWKEKTSGESPEVKAAVEKAAKWLRDDVETALKTNLWAGGKRGNLPQASDCPGLALRIHALIHAGLPADDPVIQDGVLWLERAPLAMTYDVASMAMALADHGAQAHAERLVEIGQWLVDAQRANGQWTYDGTVVKRKKGPVTTKAPGAAESAGTTAVPEIPKLVTSRGTMPGTGDNSNTQYGVLGLRAAMEVCDVPDAVFERTLRFFANSRTSQGGWDYGKGEPAYGSMTVGGISTVEICLQALERTDGLDPAEISKHRILGPAVTWMTRNFSVKENPRKEAFHYYYLYGLERAAILSGIEKFGKRDWYREGCVWLLDHQQSDGSWTEGNPGQETAFAILFLKRATKGLVGKPKRRPPLQQQPPPPPPVESGR